MIIHMSILIIEIADIDEQIQHIGTDIVFERITYLLIVVSYIEFGHQIEQIDLLHFAAVREMVQEFADIGRARDQFLQYPAKGFEDGWIIDGGEKEFYFFDIDIILSNSFF